MHAIAALLSSHDRNPVTLATTGPGSATLQARTAVAEGFTHILACGGDGTVHDVLQGLAEEGLAPEAGPVLGVIPMGTANALARHLGLSMEPLEAARQLLTFEPRTIPVGRVACVGRVRHFTVMAGCGPDGALVYSMVAQSKRSLGRLAYYVRAAVLFSRGRFEAFDLAWTDADSGVRRQMRAVATLAVRIDDLGGLFTGLAPAGAVHHPHLHLVAVRTPGWLALPTWFAGSWLGAGRWNPLVEAVCVSEFTCTPPAGVRIHVQADGEWIGAAPMQVTLIPNAVRLLMPPGSSGPNPGDSSGD
ncbi:MAG: sphingosine kinase [Acidobacteriota bacterium]|nr:sphingosine kinase [Acidobacteriota bacterium]